MLSYFSLFFQTFTVTASDGGPRPFTSSVEVTITVRRNLEAPVFEDYEQSVEIERNHRNGQEVFKLEAGDEDSAVRKIQKIDRKINPKIFFHDFFVILNSLIQDENKNLKINRYISLVL